MSLVTTTGYARLDPCLFYRAYAGSTCHVPTVLGRYFIMSIDGYFSGNDITLVYLGLQTLFDRMTR